MRVSVLVPSYRRPLDLERCLGAVAAQLRLPEQVLVVIRNGDEATVAVAHAWQGRLALQIVEVRQAGQVHALNAGLSRVTGDVVAITDDDAAPQPDWLQRILGHFETDPKVGAVGGRDWVHENGGVLTGERHLVGRFLWFGRMVGNHHLGAGPPREVDFLKGANCAFRMAAVGKIGFDSRLLGAGAQVHNDMAVCLSVKQAGWKILYDPEVAVLHFPAPRFDEDQRKAVNLDAEAKRYFNFRHAIRFGLPLRRRIVVLSWFYLVGTSADPGLVRILLMALKRDVAGLRQYMSTRRLLAQLNKAASEPGIR